jgi:uncharacterized protein YlxP (DUF503 family)
LPADIVACRDRAFARSEGMLVGVMTATMYMQGISSLKQKRSIVKSVIGRLKSRFNISVSEVDHQDSKSSAVLGIAVVSNNARFVDQQLDAVLNFMRNDGRFYLGQVDREVFS